MRLSTKTFSEGCGGQLPPCVDQMFSETKIEARNSLKGLRWLLVMDKRTDERSMKSFIFKMRSFLWDLFATCSIQTLLLSCSKLFLSGYGINIHTLGKPPLRPRQPQQQQQQQQPLQQQPRQAQQPEGPHDQPGVPLRRLRKNYPGKEVLIWRNKAFLTKILGFVCNTTISIYTKQHEQPQQ